MKKIVAAPILERVKLQYGLDSDTALAAFFGVGKQRLNNWKHDRNRLDFELVIQKCKDMDLNHLFRGTPYEGSKELAEMRARLDALEKKMKP